MGLDPLSPLGIFGLDSEKPSFEIWPLDTHEPFSVRIPEGTGLLVIEDKCIVVCPAGRGDGQNASVNFTAIHGREIRQRSVTHGDRF